jgi:tripartite-type tricarboxylate transporter receptor subunit TctC
MRILGKLVAVAGLLAAAAGSPASGIAADWPTRPITVVVPFAAGGGSDPVARRMFEAIGKKLGQNIVIDFRPGASATIGTRVVATAKPDGYTLLFTSAPPIVEARYLKDGIPYNPDTDLVPVVLALGTPMVLTANAKFPPNTFRELVDYGKANPGKINAATAGLTAREAFALVTLKAGPTFTIVPYSGTGAMLPDLMGGTVDVGAGFAAGFLPGVQSGKLKFIVALADKRASTLPDIPTTAESGYPQIKLGGWFILFAPKGTPPEIIDRLNAEVNAYLSSEEGKKQMADFGYDTIGGPPQAAVDQIKSDVAFMKELMDAGFSVNE